MSLKYVPFLELESRNISSLDFSNCGRFLAAVTFGGEIGLWDAHTGKRYNPFLTSDSAGMSTTAWIDDTTFVCGLSDGSLVTCTLIDSGITSTEIVSPFVWLEITAIFDESLQQVSFAKEQVTDEEVISLSYHRSLQRLAICGQVKVRLYSRG